MMSTPDITPVSGCGEKAVPPKWLNGYRRLIAGAVFKRRSTVTFCGELSWRFVLF